PSTGVKSSPSTMRPARMPRGRSGSAAAGIACCSKKRANAHAGAFTPPMVDITEIDRGAWSGVARDRATNGIEFASAPERAEGRFGQEGQRCRLDGGAEGDRLLGHSENHAGGLILGDGVRPTLAHRQEPARTIVAHAGHDHADGVPADLL